MYLRITTGFVALLSIASFAGSRPIEVRATATRGAASALLGPVRATEIPAGPPSSLLQPPPADGSGFGFAANAAPPFEFAAGGDSAGRALECLTAAIYYEARSEPIEGQRAVAQVVLNRVRNPAFPASVCGVVYQGSQRSTGCQFTFTCDGSLLAPRDPLAWGRARQIALQALAGAVYAPVGAATYYHTTAVSPWWAPSLTKLGQIGAHIFYRLGDAWSQRLDFRQPYGGEEPAAGAAAASAVAGLDAAVQASTGVELVSAGNDTIRVHRGATLASDGVNIHRGGEASASQAEAAASAPAADPAEGGVRIHHGTDMTPASGA